MYVHTIRKNITIYAADSNWQLMDTYMNTYPLLFLAFPIAKGSS